MQQKKQSVMKPFALSIVAASCLLAWQANAAVDCSSLPEWQSSVAYTGGAQVQKSGAAYTANWWTQGQDPASFSGPYQEWTKTDDCAGDAGSGSGNNGAVEPEAPAPTPTPPTTPEPEPTPNPAPNPSDVPSFVPGQSTVSNGDVVSYNGECFVAKNNPGVWETPSADSWFWDVVECSGSGGGSGGGVEPEEKPEEPSQPSTPTPVSVSLVAPSAGQVLKANESTEIKANVTGEQASRVEFWVNDTQLGQRSVSQGQTSYAQSWTPTAAGSATINVYVFDKNNQRIEQRMVGVSVEDAAADNTAPVVTFVSPTAGASVKKDESIAIAVSAVDAENELTKVVVKANNQQICDFDAAAGVPLNCTWTPSQAGNVVLESIATDAQSLSASASIQITVQDTVAPPTTETPSVSPPGELCKDFNVYPDWPQGDHATGGDIVVYNNIAYSAVYWTQTVPGSDGSWALHVNCDGTAPGTAPLLSLPNRNDPVRLEVKGWPSTLVVASPSSSDVPSTFTLETTNSADLTDIEILTRDFVSVIQAAEQADSVSFIIKTDVLDKAAKDKDLAGSVAVKQALLSALEKTGASLGNDKVNALTDDVKGWAQATNLILSTLAPDATFGWSLTIGDFAFADHSGRRSVWDAASQYAADILYQFDLYNKETQVEADFVAFAKSDKTAALSADQWYYALEFVKQVTDFVNSPAMLATVPVDQATAYFMGGGNDERHLRQAAYSNVFAIIFDKNSAALTAAIAQYQNARIPLYNLEETANHTELTRIAQLNRELEQAGDVINNEAFLYETPESEWIPSSVYKWEDFLTAVKAMHNIGVAGNKLWLLDDGADDETNIKYAKVALAAFLAQSMQETIRYNACDENNWAEIRHGSVADYPMSAACGQLGQKYADYGYNAATGKDHPYSCPRNDKMEVSAVTHSKWYGAPAPVFAAPDAVLAEKGLLVNGHAGRWTNNGHCNDVPEAVDTSKQVWERDQCKVYVGQKAGSFLWDGSSQESVQGCGWWGRGVIQTTGRQNFGTLNHYLGRSHVAPELIGTTVDGVTVEAPPANPLYAELDFCSNPELICSSEESKEIKWIAGLFYWVTSVQAYSNPGGPYADWNYYNKLKDYVDGGMQGSDFIDSVSGIVNRGCPSNVCDTGEVHAAPERRENFKLILRSLGLNPQ